ncbi:hypothetical protein QR680_017044 [Steinernema hermaphroditum]|uniref:Cap-specific mRNA (nucleoside-2'-O-)-methyltransferase 2 n=1 Tax=Steinernema hermaphroditum TaxID=289476 RepID=A0AA39LNE8_9BILA|nr:hypothetical protein QR680_017044 [Steinernema hermaphroditum]
MTPTYELILDKIFEKRFDLKMRGALAFSDDTTESTKDFEALYDEVDSLKIFPKPSDWHDHTTFTHAMKNLSRELQRQRGVAHASQAYCKLTELFHTNPEMTINGAGDSVFRSLHLCEAPGAFIRATVDHFARGVVEWSATSFNPYFEWNAPEEMFVEDDDDMVLRFPKRWNFGRSNSGDVFEACPEDFVEATFDLVTADGSLRCDITEKESATVSLFRQEIDLAFFALREGGDFVLKMYSWRSEEMRALLQICLDHFQTVRICKPSASKPGSYEVYLVCCSYSREPSVSSSHDLALQNALLYSAAKFFIDHQILMSTFNRDSYENWSRKLQNYITTANRSATSTWIQMFVRKGFVSVYERSAAPTGKPWRNKKAILKSRDLEKSISIDVDWRWEWTFAEDVTYGIARKDTPIINSLFLHDGHPRETELKDLCHSDFSLNGRVMKDGYDWIQFVLDSLLHREEPFELDLGDRLLLSRLSASIVGAMCSLYRKVTLKKGSITFSEQVDQRELERLGTFLSAVTRNNGQDLLSIASAAKMAEPTFYSIILFINITVGLSGNNESTQATLESKGLQITLIRQLLDVRLH